MGDVVMGEIIPGLGRINDLYRNDFIDIEQAGQGLWRVGTEGVRRILTPIDKKTELIVFDNKTLIYVKSAMGYPAIYQLRDVSFQDPARAVLMDLDGTTVRSEGFWIRIIQLTTARLLDNPRFQLESNDAPFVSGHSVSEHLQYCIAKYCPEKTIEEARKIYFEVTRRQMDEVGKGNVDETFFVPSPGLKEFLMTLKANRIKIGLVTSGLYEKAWPEITAVFKSMGLGNPLDFYDAIITAGFRLGKGQVGTLGELTPKPHPWLYAETARVGLGLDDLQRNKVIAIEDSAAGIIAIRLAGFAGIGMKEGNIAAGGCRPFMYAECNNLMEALPIILGEAELDSV